MVLENLVIPFQINNKIKGTIVRLSSVASKIKTFRKIIVFPLNKILIYCLLFYSGESF